LRRRELRERRGIGRCARAEADLTDLRARLSNGHIGAFLEIRRALDGLDEIRNQVRASLVGRFDLRPLRLDGLIEGDEPVVRASDGKDDDQHESDEHAESDKNPAHAR
jgi:hypothetical protein